MAEIEKEEQDFQSVTIPPLELLKLNILQRRSYVIDAMECYDKIDGRDIKSNTYIVRSGMLAYFREIGFAIKHDFNKNLKSDKTNKADKFKELQEQIKSTDYKELTKAFYTIEEWLYEKKLTKFDVVQPMGGNIIKRNTAKGWN